MNIDTILLHTELNLNGLGSIQIAELYMLDGITSNIQTQINNLSGNTNLLSSNNIFTGTNQFNNNIIVDNKTITPIELSYIDGTTSNIQTQLNDKVSLSNNNSILGINTFEKPIILKKNSGVNIGVFNYNNENLTSTGLFNVSIGSSNLSNLTNGTVNVAIGDNCLKNITYNNYNIGIGYQSGKDFINGNNNIFIGSSADVIDNGSYSSSVAIGNNSKIKNSNSIVLGTANETTYIDGNLIVGGTTNKNLTLLGNNNISTTPDYGDVSNKIATTQFIDNKLTTPNTYVGTVYMIPTSLSLTSTFQDLATITIPVAGTYELLSNVSFVSSRRITMRLFNNTTSLEIPNTLCVLQDMADVTGNIESSISKLFLIENIPVNTVIKLQSKLDSGTSTVYSDNVFGRTSLSYKMLGLTTNTISPNIFKFIGNVIVSNDSNPQYILTFGIFSITIIGAHYNKPYLTTSSTSNVDIVITGNSDQQTNLSYYGGCLNISLNNTNGTYLTSNFVNPALVMSPNRSIYSIITDSTNNNMYRLTYVHLSGNASPGTIKLSIYIEKLI